MALSVQEIVDLFSTRGAASYGSEAVSQLDHALQCAQLAENAGASAELVCASLLHDLGHLVADRPHAGGDARDDLHQLVALPFLRGRFGDAVLEPIRMHVDAKRYLCAVSSSYWDSLSPASKHSLELQGGPFDEASAGKFIRQPHAEAATLLRRWDDLAKTPGTPTRSIEHFARMMQACQR